MNTRSRTVRFVAVATILGGLLIGGGASAAANSQAKDGDGPHFYSGAAVDVSETVNGDVYAAAQSVTISGDIRGDVIAAAQTVTISGTVDGDVRIAGQAVTISGDVTRSGTIFAASLIIPNGGSVGDDIVATAGSISITGEVGRDLMLGVGELNIDGRVGGDVTYTSDRGANIADGAVQGTVEHVRTEASEQVSTSPWTVVVGWLLGLLYALVALSLITIAAGLLIPRWLHRVTDELVPSPWRALLVGFLASIVVPVALLFLLVTIVGAPLALAGMLVWLVLSLATFLAGSFYLGRLVLRGQHHPALVSFLGGLILIVALQIPWLNILVWLAMMFFGLGAQLLQLYRQRPWRVTSLTPATPGERTVPQSE